MGNPNIILFYQSRFLILPKSEIVFDDDGVIVDKETLNTAFDVTPKLPSRILGSAWQHKIVFKSEIDLIWAADVARFSTLSAHEIVDRFMEV